MHAVKAVLLIQVHNHFAITARLKAVATSAQLIPQLDKVVNLGIRDQGQGIVFVVERLPATRKVYDAEAAHGQSDMLVPELPSAVRATVCHDFGQVRHQCEVFARQRVAGHRASYPAHRAFTFSQRFAFVSGFHARLYKRRKSGLPDHQFFRSSANTYQSSFTHGVRIPASTSSAAFRP